jgi:hypothetical protein
MAILNSYVKVPEGKDHLDKVSDTLWGQSLKTIVGPGTHNVWSAGNLRTGFKVWTTSIIPSGNLT